MPETVSLEIGGRTLVFETGELAKQANGSALVRYGDQNVVLAAVTASDKPREGIDFFPLTCDFEEKMYAAGKIPGGYIKREGRPSEHGVLSARQIDRPIRPLFPEGFRNDVQIITTVLSIDSELDADVLAVCAAGAALAVSDIPFEKTVAAVRVGRDEAKNYIVNPTLPQYETGGMDIVVAGTADAVMMVEGGGHEISEDDFSAPSLSRTRRSRQIVAAIDRARARRPANPNARFRCCSSDPELKAWIGKDLQERRRARRCASPKKASATRRSPSSRAPKRSTRCGKKDDAIRAQARRSQPTRISRSSSRRWRRKNSASWSSTIRFVPTAASPTRFVRSGRRCTTCRASMARACSRAVRRRCSRRRRSAASATSSVSTESWRFRTSATCTTTTSRRTRRERRNRCARRDVARSVTATSPNARSFRCCRRSTSFPTRCASSAKCSNRTDRHRWRRSAVRRWP